jgi:hypothetical protein
LVPSVSSNRSSSTDIQLHAALILLKMSLDAEYGDDLAQTMEANLNTLLDCLSSNISDLSTLLVEAVKEAPLQHQLLHRLPIYPAFVAKFRQSLAKQFLSLDPDAPLSALSEYLYNSYPFTEIRRDMANHHARAVKYAVLIFDIAISKPPRENQDITGDIICELKHMHRRIIDGRAAFLVRTEAKEIIQRVYMRVEDAWLGKKRARMESMDMELSFVPSKRVHKV